MPKTKILAAVPVYHAIEPEPAMCFILLSQYAGIAETQDKFALRWLIAGPKMSVRMARNNACANALKGQADWLCMIDDDMLVRPPQIIEALISHDKDIIAPLFFRSSENYDPLIFKQNKEGNLEPYHDYPRNSLVKVDGVGTGMILIKRKVLEKLVDPWFVYPTDPLKSMDLYFCDRAQQAGFEIWCDTSIIVKQMSPGNPIGEEEYIAQKCLTSIE